MTAKKSEVCSKEACAIQKCLQENHYQESRCTQVINFLKACCEKNSQSNSTHCNGFRSKENNKPTTRMNHMPRTET